MVVLALRRIKHCFANYCVAILLVTLSTASASCIIPSDLAILKTLDPEAEAKKIIEHGEIIFLGVLGIGLEVPGVLGYAGCWKRKSMVVIIPGTTDAVCSEEHAELQDVAYKYSASFNQEILKSNTELKLHECMNQ